MMTFSLLMLPVGFVISVLLCTLLLAAGRRQRWLDKTGAERHKQHTQDTVNVGGVAIAAALVMPLLVIMGVVSLVSVGQVERVSPALAIHWPGLGSRLEMGWGLLLGLIVMHITGLTDDRVGLGPWIKLGIQAVVATMMVLCCDLQIMAFLDAYGSAGSALSMVLSVGWLVAVMNAINFMDNADALAGGVAAIIAAAMLGMAVGQEQWFVAAMSALLLGAVVGFLVFNVPPAKMFMGDGGSLVLGLVLGFIAVRLTYVEMPRSQGVGFADALPLLSPLLWLTIPLYDMASVFVIRVQQGVSPMRGDHNHLSHRLMRLGLGSKQAVAVIHALTGVTCLGGLGVGFGSGSVRVAGLGAVVAVVLGLLVMDLKYSTVERPSPC